MPEPTSAESATTFGLGEDLFALSSEWAGWQQNLREAEREEKWRSAIIEHSGPLASNPACIARNNFFGARDGNR